MDFLSHLEMIMYEDRRPLYVYVCVCVWVGFA